MSASEIYERTRGYLRKESSLKELHRWVSENLPELLLNEGSPDYELASLLEHCFSEYLLDTLDGFDESELAKALLTFFTIKKLAISS